MITLQQVQEASILLADQIEEWWQNFDVVLAIGKGWLIIAYYIAKVLWIHSVQVVSVKSYNWKTQDTIKDYTPELNIYPWARYLIVDDLLDTWATMEYTLNTYFKQSWALYKTAVLYQKKHSKVNADYCFANIGDQRIDFEFDNLGLTS